jgi:hypothetical protein
MEFRCPFCGGACTRQGEDALLLLRCLQCGANGQARRRMVEHGRFVIAVAFQHPKKKKTVKRFDVPLT